MINNYTKGRILKEFPSLVEDGVISFIKISSTSHDLKVDESKIREYISISDQGTSGEYSHFCRRYKKELGR